MAHNHVKNTKHSNLFEKSYNDLYNMTLKLYMNDEEINRLNKREKSNRTHYKRRDIGLDLLLLKTKQYVIVHATKSLYLSKTVENKASRVSFAYAERFPTQEDAFEFLCSTEYFNDKYIVIPENYACLY